MDSDYHLLRGNDSLGSLLGFDHKIVRTDHKIVIGHIFAAIAADNGHGCRELALQPIGGR